jgi:hypothetical protein
LYLLVAKVYSVWKRLQTVRSDLSEREHCMLTIGLDMLVHLVVKDLKNHLASLFKEYRLYRLHNT